MRAGGQDNALGRRLVLVLLALLIPIRIGLGLLPGFPPDLQMYKRWALWGAAKGIHRLYEERSTYDYLPLYGYLLTPAGEIELRLDHAHARKLLRSSPTQVANMAPSPVFSLLVKIPPLVFDVLIAGLLLVLVRRHDLWRSRATWDGWLPALIFLYHPAVLCLSGYWGQADSVETFFILASITLVLLRRPKTGWAAAALGCLMKPLAVPYLPLLALATLSRSGWRRLLTGGLAFVGTTVLGFAPFIVTGRFADALGKIVSDVDAMPFTTVNGHNLWWLLDPWTPATEAWLGPLTAKTLGLSLVAAASAAVLTWVWCVDRGRAAADPSGEATGDEGLAAQSHWIAAAAMSGFTFFVFATHMHENHLFPVLPLLILLAGRGPAWMALMLATGATIATNLLIHDHYLGELFLGHLGGPSDFLHPGLAMYGQIQEGLTRSPHLSRFELWVANINTGVTLACYVALVWLSIRDFPVLRGAKAMKVECEEEAR